MYLAKSVWPDGNEGDGEDGSGAGSSSSSSASGGNSNWQALVDKALVAKGNIHAAMLINSKDGTVLAATPNFTVIIHLYTFIIIIVTNFFLLFLLVA